MNDGRVVVTDVDGCLLDETYRWEPARPALDALKKRGIPLVLCSSKTRAEMEPLHADLGLDAP
jgi:mannosyl-3-phosphoglycerate phosphatase